MREEARLKEAALTQEIGEWADWYETCCANGGLCVAGGCEAETVEGDGCDELSLEPRAVAGSLSSRVMADVAEQG